MIDKLSEYKKIEQFIRETFKQPEDLIQCGRPYFWFESKNNGNTVRALLIHGDYAVNIECVYGFYGYPCDCNSYYVYKDKSIASIFKEVWNKGGTKKLIHDMGHIMALRKFFHKIFNKRTQLAKYEEDYFIDTLSMLSKMINSNIAIPDDLSLKNLHDYAAEHISLEQYLNYAESYLHYNKDVCGLSGTYLGYDVIIPKDIKEHHAKGIPFRNCISDYIPKVDASSKVVYVYDKHEKPIYCVFLEFPSFLIREAKLPCNKSLTPKQQKELKSIIGAVRDRNQDGKKKKGILSRIGLIPDRG